MGGQAGIAIGEGITANGVRREEELEAFGIRGRRAMPLIHVPAADPTCARRHADLIAPAIIADDGAHRVRAVTIVVAGHGGIGSARATTAVDGVVPVIVVRRSDPVVAAVLIDQGRVIPVVARILSGDHDALPGVSQRPHIVSVDAGHVPLDSIRHQAVHRIRLWFRQGLTDLRVGDDARDLGALGQVDE